MTYILLSDAKNLLISEIRIPPITPAAAAHAYTSDCIISELKYMHTAIVTIPAAIHPISAPFAGSLPIQDLWIKAPITDPAIPAAYITIMNLAEVAEVKVEVTPEVSTPTSASMIVAAAAMIYDSAISAPAPV